MKANCPTHGNFKISWKDITPVCPECAKRVISPELCLMTNTVAMTDTWGEKQCGCHYHSVYGFVIIADCVEHDK